MPETLRILRYDQSGERTSTHFNVAALADTTLVDAQATATALQNALNGISLAAARKVDQTVNFATVPAATAAGNRELKWLLRIQDSVNGFAFSHEVGCADESMGVISVGGKTIMDPDASEYTSLKAAIEANAISPYGNAVTLIEAELVGRNL